MRAHEIKHYESILDALQEPGCPLCAFLRNIQVQLVQTSEQCAVTCLCNAHAWAVAAVSGAEKAAKVFLPLLEQSASLCDCQQRACTLCLRLKDEEHKNIKDLAANLQESRVIYWLRHGTICHPHAEKLKEGLPIRACGLIDGALNRRRAELLTALKGLLAEASRGSSEHSGILGRAAEYLVSQRGLPVE